MEIELSQIGVTLLCMLPRRLFRPAFGDKGSSDARGYDYCAKLIPEEDSHLIEVYARFSRQVVVERVDH